MIHPYWDMALLDVEGLDASTPALKLSCHDTRSMAGTQIAVIGYPAFDSRNPAIVQNTLFANRYGVKRLQPGELHGAIEAASFGKVVRAATHDCSTLGGNSGSAILDLGSGEVLGLHFGGLFHDINYCVPADALAADSRVVDAGVALADTPPPAAAELTIWWTRADRTEQVAIAQTALAPSALAPGATMPSAAVAPGPPAATGVTVQIPLNITLTISAGVVTHVVALQESMSAPATEAMREPEHDSDYSSRKGYDEAFLGKGVAFRAPLPAARDASVLAPTLEGSTILSYENFSVAMHAKRRLALFTASNVSRDPAMRGQGSGFATTRTALSGLGKNDTEKWFTDPRMDIRYQLPDIFFTKDRQAFDKGHIVRRDDVAWGPGYAELKRANGDTYHVTNCSPQVGKFNQSAKGDDNWGDLENHVFSSAGSERLSVFAGPVLDPADQIFVGVSDDGKPLRVRIPSRFWKAIFAATASGVAAFGFVLEQDLGDVPFDEIVVPDAFLPMLTPLATIENMTGVKFSPHLLASDQFDTPAANELVLRGVARHAEERN
jgi:endonuclease G